MSKRAAYSLTVLMASACAGPLEPEREAQGSARATPTAQSPAAAAQPAPICPAPVPAPPGPRFAPWFFHPGSGQPILGGHQFHEDRRTTHRVLARNLVHPLGQPTDLPDVLRLNEPLYHPPEGEPAAPGQRRLLLSSLTGGGLELYVNYSDTPMVPGTSNPKYWKPSFFLSIDAPVNNYQTTPPVMMSGLSSLLIAPTHAAFGCLTGPVGAFGEGSCDDLFVTAGLTFGTGELDADPDHQALLRALETDRLLARDPRGHWRDVSDEPCPGGGVRVPAVLREGPSAGVVFADLTGDGFADLFLGRYGASYAGDTALLLVNDGSGCFTDETIPRIIDGPVKRATVEVVSADLDADGDRDLVVANRCARAGCGEESVDDLYVNDGFGHFSRTNLGGPGTNSRSVAVGDLNGDGLPELVFADDDSTGLEHDLNLPPDLNPPLRVYFRKPAPGPYADLALEVLNPGQEEASSQGARQVLIADVVGAAGWVPDGKKDLIVVSFRETLRTLLPLIPIPGANLTVFGNLGSWSDPSDPEAELIITHYLPRAWVRTAAVADFTGEGELDLFLGRGHRHGGVEAELLFSLGPTYVPPYILDGTSYRTMPGVEHGYGFDFADVNDDGLLDYVQTSRAYDFLGLSTGDPADGLIHVNLAHGDLGTGWTSNLRGLQRPQGMEDGVFADFDEDGDLDLLMASQRTAAAALPAGPAHASPDTMLLVNHGFGGFGYDYTGDPWSQVEDARIDLGARVTQPSLADRALAGDLDNDGDTDAIVHLFPLLAPGVSQRVPVSPPHFNQPIHTYSFGWRYLENIHGQHPTRWFRDVAPTRMQGPTGGYDPSWNVTLGMDVLADFDNNGALDLYSTQGFAETAAAVSTVALARDHLFLNGVLGQGVGKLRERSQALLPPPCQDVVQDNSTEPAYVTCGSFGLAQGDLDNDGDADVVVAHFGVGISRTNYPWLLVNRLNEVTGRFTDEWAARVGPLSDFIFASDVDETGLATTDMDHSMFPAIFDFDADGDQDLVYQVVNEAPRFLENMGADLNLDGRIDALDGSPLGQFRDASPEAVTVHKATTDAQDMQPVDLDGDGDLDLAVEPFSDQAMLWQNLRPVDPGVPVVTEAWPRVGRVRGALLQLSGARLDGVDQLELHFAGGQSCLAPVLSAEPTRLTTFIPDFCPIGLAQVRVRRVDPCGDVHHSRQYFGYFVLGGS